MWVEFGLWLILVPVTMGIIVGVSHEYKSLPAWFHKIAFVIGKIFKAFAYVAFACFVLFVLLPVVTQEAAMWLFPNSALGYAMKYELP